MKNLKRQTIKAGKLLITENDVSRKLFILRTGKVRVFKEYMGGKVVLAILGRGEVFGELSFFDAKPRSASVEAITDVVVDCIDGEEIEADLQTLPPWLKLIFNVISTRFREVDQKMTLLKSLSQFQRKTFSNDTVANTIYADLLRIMKVLRMIINSKGNSLSKPELLTELNDSIGTSHVSCKSFLTLLEDYDFTLETEKKEKDFVIKENAYNDFESFLKEQYEQDNCIILNHYAIGMLRKMMSFLEEGEQNSTAFLLPKEAVAFDEDDEDMALAFKQLLKTKLVKEEGGFYFVNPPDLIKKFKYYSIVKSFDHTIIYND